MSFAGPSIIFQFDQIKAFFCTSCNLNPHHIDLAPSWYTCCPTLAHPSPVLAGTFPSCLSHLYCVHYLLVLPGLVLDQALQLLKGEVIMVVDVSREIY